MSLRGARISAAVVGGLVLAWQIGNALRGRFVHEFLVADLVLAPILLLGSFVRSDRRAGATMLAGFAALGGVFLCATTMRLLRGGYDLGTALTTLGLIPCLAWSLWLGKWLALEDDHRIEPEPRVENRA